MLVADADYPLLNIIWTMIVFFGLVIWLRLLFTVFGDVFSRDDLSGGAKAGWCVLAIILPFLGVFIYLVTQGDGLAERNNKRMRAQAQQVLGATESAGSSEEIAKAKQLLDSGAITQDEFDSLKQKALS